MKNFSLSMKLIAGCMALIFSWDQIVFAEAVAPYASYQIPPAQIATEAVGTVSQDMSITSAAMTTTTDFLLNETSPLSVPENNTQPEAIAKTYDQDGKLRSELSPEGRTLRHVYEGESVQSVIDQSAAGDTVFLHSGTYHEKLILRSGIDLKGEDAQRTVLHGDFQTGAQVIRALGNNRIEGLTISGGGAYAGTPASAIRVEGDGVKIRSNRILDNRDYGIQIWQGADTLIEMNLFKATHLGVQLPQDTTVIRYNTFVGSDIAVNVLGGARPLIQNNIFTESTFASIYEFSWEAYSHGQPSRGLAAIENNTFWKNTERGSYYGSAIPPAVEAQTTGNLKANPGFVNAAAADYRVSSVSISQGRGAFLPEALTAALDRASSIPAKNKIQNITDGTALIGYRILYEEGSHEEFYNDGRQILDTTPPVIAFPSAQVYTRQNIYEWVYTVDGIEKKVTFDLQAGENQFTLSARDIFGRLSERSVTISCDTLAPQGSVTIDQGRNETSSGTAVVSIDASDDLSPLHRVRFSMDGGARWTEWEPYQPNKVVDLPQGTGFKTVLCQIEDAAGNQATFSDAIYYTTAPLPPVIEVTSGVVTEQRLYTLSYTVDGVSHQELWQLQAGPNELLIGATNGAVPVYRSHVVTYIGGNPILSIMPEIPVLAPDLISLTAQNGLILKYAGETLVLIEQPGVYSLYLPVLDAANALIGGLLVFPNGDRLLYKNGRPLYLLKPSGEKIAYNSDGTVAYGIGENDQKTRFAYQKDASGNVLSILSFEPGVTTRYDSDAKPVWIKKEDGVQVYYDEGFLTGYVNAAGDYFHYDVSIDRRGNDLAGYTSRIVGVRPAGFSSEIPYAEFLSNQSSFPTARQTLQNDILETLDYDPTGKITQVISGKGEVLQLMNGIPAFFTDAAQQSSLIESQISENGDLLSLSWSRGNESEQVFDPMGRLTGIRLSDGVTLQVTGSTLQKISLGDGSFLDHLTWNGQQLTGFTRIKADGSKEVYWNSRILSREDAQGNVTGFLNGLSQTIQTEDGRTYHIFDSTNAAGVTERLTELSSIAWPDGSRVEFEHGVPVRYVYNAFAPIEPEDLPEFEEGKFFIPQIDLKDAQLRALTVDVSGTIFSGQVLFREGTQYFIEDGKIVKQVTATGQLAEFAEEPLPPVQLPSFLPAAPLTDVEEAYRDELIETQLDYFVAGKGLHAGTGLPVDHYDGTGDRPSDYSQATLVGFWAEILASIAAGDQVTDKMSREGAFEKLRALLDTYREVQRQVGWNGMVAFFKIFEDREPVLDNAGVPTGETRTTYRYENSFNQYGFGDALNLAVSLASVIGALGSLALDPDLGSSRDQIVARAQEILTAQEPGYAAFYDPSQKRFHGAYGLDAGTQEWEFIHDYHMDRVFNEFRTGMIWLAAQYPQYQDALKNLDVAIRPFETRAGEVIDLATPYDGGAFQMFWPLIHVDETQYPEFDVALRNFLYVQAEFASVNGIPGLLSAGDVPLQGYQGKIGLPGAAETDDLLRTDTGSLYGTAGAFSLAPHYTLQFLKNMEASFPDMRTGAGFVDAIRLQPVDQTDPGTGETVAATVPVYSDQYYGVDQASFILSLSKTSQKYFKNYLERTGARASFEALYQGLSFKLNPAVETNPPPPDFGENTSLLYAGSSVTPDGLSAGLIKQQAFVPVLTDAAWGEGRVFNYLTPSGKFHHVEIEFGSGEDLRRINLQEYCLAPQHAGSATALLGAVQRDLLNLASSQGVFYTPGSGASGSMLVMDPGIGEVRHLSFQFLSASKPVGIWANYPELDLSGYDFLSVPVKLAPGTPENVRLKFEFKGMGEVFLTGALSQDWQYISMPIPKPSGALNQLAISIQPLDGQAIAGDLYLGPLSVLKVRTSNAMDWGLLLGRTESEIRTLIQEKLLVQANHGNGYAQQETLENFTVDSGGKLVSGILQRADGGIQYFQKGQLVKWVFRNGRTILFENGLATFLLDLARGRLETGRFYYDQSFRGEIRSFIVQENESQKIFDADGQLTTLLEDGYTVHFQEGRIQSLQTEKATLTDLEFSDDGELAKAHVAFAGGGGMDIDETGEQGIDVGGGVKVFYDGSRITAIETPQNGITYFIHYLDSLGLKSTNVFAQFPETVTDPQTGTATTVYRFMTLSEYLQRPERAIEKTHILEVPPVNVLEHPDVVEGFSVGVLPAGELTVASGGGAPAGALARYYFRYQSLNGPVLGMSVKHPAAPVALQDYDFLTLTLQKDPSMDWGQTLQLTLKTADQTSLYSFQMDATQGEAQTFQFPLAYKAGVEAEVTLEVLRQAEGIGKMGTLYIKDISYLSLKKIVRPLWEGPAGILASKLKSLRIEASQLTSVGAEIASQRPVVYTALAALLNTPTLLRYQNTTEGDPELVSFSRFDGTQVELEGEHVTRMTLPEGTVNEYTVSQNSSQGTASGDGGTMNYHYGALRKITQADGREYLLSYEFDADGAEITVFKDLLSGEERRFKDGKLLSATDPSELQTRYAYENGALIGAQMTYNERVLNSTHYSFNRNGTQVTDERGTTWFYDASGVLVKHLTKDGYLYEYSDYTQEPGVGETFSVSVLKNALFSASGLRAVQLIGYESPDGSQVLFDLNKNGTGEVHLTGGGHGVNLSFDPDQNIQSGQIQFPDGLILEIGNYVPVRGRFSNGELFSIPLPPAETYEILQDDQKRWAGFRLRNGDWFSSYDPEGRLTTAESLNGTKHTFTYATDAAGHVTAYTRLEHSQMAFNGVPFPKEVSLVAETTQKLLDETGQEIGRHEGNGFLAGIYKAGTNQWDLCMGSFGSSGDRATLKNFLLGIKPGESFAMAVSDASFSQADSEILTLLESLGAGQIRQAAGANSSWTFFGRQGLGQGQGREKVGANVFSTMEEKTETVAVAAGTTPLFLNGPMLLNTPSVVRQAYAQFLERYEELKSPQDMQSTTVYDTEGQIVYTNRIDGMKAYYEFGKIRETYNAGGELVAVHEYGCPAGGCQGPEDAILKKITLVKARRDFETESQRLKQQIEQAKFDALYRLAGQDEAARLQIKESVESGVAQISSQIIALQAQRFQGHKVCRRYVFWKVCHEETFEVPGVQDAIDRLAVQRSELVVVGETQLAGIPGAVTSKKLEIEQATAGKMQELELKRQEFLREVLHQEMEPILTDFYRRILGRDASKAELDHWVDRSKDAGEIDTAALTRELQNSSEKAAREAEKAAIIAGVQDFLEDYGAASAEEKSQRLQALRLNISEVVTLTSADITKILEWLRSRDLHFGQSAFLSLKEMLASKGVEVPMEVIAKETILIDILMGVIHKFTEGDLLISIFALDRAAMIHGQDFASVKFTYDDLRAAYQSSSGLPSEGCGLRVIAHIGEDHFVVLEKVTETEVTYRETGKGPAGESVTIPKDQFLKVWIAKDNAGYLLVSEEQALPEKKLSDQEAMKIRGAFWFIFFFIASLAFSAASMVVSIFSPAFGKILGYAALVAGIIGIVAGLGGFVVQGMQSVFSAITSQSIFTTIKQGFLYAGKMLWDSVTYVGRFFQNGFVFLKECFTGGLNAIGAGLIRVKDFLVAPAQAIIKDGVTTGFEFSFAQNMARQLVTAGLTVGASQGLEGLGLDPRLTQLAIAFVGGGFLGAGSATSSFIRSGLQQMALQGVSQIANHLGLAPPFANVLSLVATQSLTAFFDPALTLKAIAPTLAAQLTMGGIDLLGRSLGLDPCITQLLGLPFTALAGKMLEAFVTPGFNILSPGNIFRLFKDAVLSRETASGLISLGLDFVSERLDLNPLFTALGLRLATAGVIGAINPDQTIVSAVAEAFLRSVKRLNPWGDLNGISPESLTSYMRQAITFSEVVRQRGLLGALSEYAMAIFERDALESIFNQGGLADILIGKAEYTVVNGIPVKAVHVDANNDLYFSTNDDSLLLGRRLGNQIESGVFVIGSDGQFLLKEGVVETDLSDGFHTVLVVKDGQAYGYRVFSDDKDLFEIFATGGNQITLNPDGTIYSAIFINKVNGARLEFSQGQLVSLSLPAASGQSLNLSGMTLAKLTSLQKQGLVAYVASNGIWNPEPEGVLPDYAINLVNRLVERGVDPSSIFMAPMFENGDPVTDTFSWVTDMLGGDQLTDELINKMDQKWIAMTPAQRDHGVVSILYSGSVNPFLKAIDRRDYNVSTIISLGGPSLEGTFIEGHIDNPHVKTFVNIYGDKDFVPLVGPVLGGGKSFDGVETLNIKILGAGHLSYFPAADGSNKIGKFVAEIARLADFENKNALTDFLAKYKQGDTYVVDSAALPSEYE